MPRKRPIIQDMAMIAFAKRGGNPIGEALKGSDPVPALPMSVLERQDMVGRLENTIKGFMDEANTVYQANCKKPGTADVDPEYITRLSTNEFFFYTKEPLTLAEFEALQNKIADKAKTLPSGVQLMLGSFAVQTDTGEVMNVTPHITCGASPDFQFIVKNKTSSIDVRYKVPGVGTTLPALDADNPAFPMPKITVDGVSRNLSFDNIVHCKTPGGTPFITGLDICLDHAYGRVKDNYEHLIKITPALSSQAVSHVVLSNCISLDERYCLGTAVMHADPADSPKKCKPGVAQEGGPVRRMRDLGFGDDYVRTFTVAPEKVHHLDERVVNDYAHKVVYSADKRGYHAYESNLDNASFGRRDKTTAEFINFKNQYKDFVGDHLKTRILEDFKNRIQETTTKEELELLKTELKSSAGYDVLKTSQGFVTWAFNLDTSSVKALDSMFQQQEKYFEEAAANVAV